MLPTRAQNEASQVFIRAISRYYAKQASVEKAAHDAKLAADASKAQDVSGTQEISLSHAADARLAAGQQYIAKMQLLFKVRAFHILLCQRYKIVLHYQTEAIIFHPAGCHPHSPES